MNVEDLLIEYLKLNGNIDLALCTGAPHKCGSRDLPHPIYLIRDDVCTVTCEMGDIDSYYFTGYNLVECLSEAVAGLKHWEDHPDEKEYVLATKWLDYLNEVAACEDDDWADRLGEKWE